YTHGDSDELLLVVAGTVHADVDGKSYVLNEGDALYYRSSMPHTVQNRSEAEVEVLWVICPPS
ncbi:MAG: cupin domain-containing protein, partial [Rhizobiaceae bacterium]|nr:cupin domain-containing protein [Rhizobiaceae bacterium]